MSALAGSLLRRAASADVADRLDAAVAELKSRPPSSFGAQVDKGIRRALAGKAAMLVLAVAAVRTRGTGQPWGTAFVEHRFDQALAAVKADSGTELATISLGELDKTVAGYTESIGDIEQELLRRG